MTDLSLQNETISKQRRELQLLIGELKDRDQELNEMVAAHHQQLTAWERDRQRVLDLEQVNGKLGAEIRKRNEQLRLLIQRLKSADIRQKNKDSFIEAAKSKLTEADEAICKVSTEKRDLENMNNSLNNSIDELHVKLGQLETREQDYLTKLQLKDGDLVDAHSHIADLKSKIRRLDAELHECQRVSTSSRAEIDDYKAKWRQCKAELDRCSAEMVTKSGDVTSLRQELFKLREQVQACRRDVTLRDEELRRKDELVELQKSKQVRADSELSTLRQLYDRQQEDLSLLHLNLEKSQDLLAQQEMRLNSLSASIGVHSNEAADETLRVLRKCNREAIKTLELAKGKVAGQLSDCFDLPTKQACQAGTRPGKRCGASPMTVSARHPGKSTYYRHPMYGASRRGGVGGGGYSKPTNKPGWRLPDAHLRPGVVPICRRSYSSDELFRRDDDEDLSRHHPARDHRSSSHHATRPTAKHQQHRPTKQQQRQRVSGSEKPVVEEKQELEASCEQQGVKKEGDCQAKDIEEKCDNQRPSPDDFSWDIRSWDNVLAQHCNSAGRSSAGRLSRGRQIASRTESRPKSSSESDDDDKKVSLRRASHQSTNTGDGSSSSKHQPTIRALYRGFSENYFKHEDATPGERVHAGSERKGSLETQYRSCNDDTDDHKEDNQFALDGSLVRLLNEAVDKVSRPFKDFPFSNDTGSVPSSQSQRELDSEEIEVCSQTTNELLDEAKRTADDLSISLLRSSSERSPRHRTSPRSSRYHPQDRTTPTGKLQRLLSESREMMNDLDRSYSKRSPARSTS